MSIEKKDDYKYKKQSYDIPFHKDKYEKIERDDKIEYSDFLYNRPPCLLLFNNGPWCGGPLIKGQRPYSIGDGSFHDAYIQCGTCETLKTIKNKIEEFEKIKKRDKEFINKEVKIQKYICKTSKEFIIKDKEVYCSIYGEYKDVQFCEKIKCKYLDKKYITIKLENIFNQIKI